MFFAFLMFPACIIVDEPSELTIVNESDYDLIELRLAPIDSGVWGPNELGRDPLYAGGDSITLGGIPCDTYDILIVDDLGAECVLRDRSLCLGDEDLEIITNTQLLLCPFSR
jgi:hypothetical protein